MKIISYLIIPFFLSACTYIKNYAKQNQLLQIQEINPRQHNLKHIIDQETFIIYGLLVDKLGKTNHQSFSVAAYSDRFKPHELVDVAHFANAGRHYVLNLPVGKYDLLVLTDKDNNKILEQSEVVGHRKLELDQSKNTAKALTDVDINLSNFTTIDWTVSIPVLNPPELTDSLVLPKGAIRRLDDPIFSPEVATLGVYDPAAFLEQAPAVFYTLEEYLPYKVPVIFVHGMGGTAREFIPIVNKMDRAHYMPWFYYYPSGSDLDKSAEIFYRLFLSGELFPRIGPAMIIVAHSMGGLVVREAINLQQGTNNENTVALLVTLASPFGGHPDSAFALSAPLIVPAWRDLNPHGRFIENLFRKPLPTSVNHQLFYAYVNPDTFTQEESSDGVVPLSSQLHPAAKIQSNRSIGLNTSHTGILKDAVAIEHITSLFQSVKGFYPESHIRVMQSGGYDVDLGDRYNNKEKYFIKFLGKYLAALWQRKLKAITPFQQHFVDVFHGTASASHIAEKAWVKFSKEYPDLIEDK